MGAGRDTARRVSRKDLILQYIFRFAIEFVGNFVDACNFIIRGRFGGLTEEAPNGFRDKRCAVGRDVVDLLRQILWKVHLHAHARNSKPGLRRDATDTDVCRDR